MIIPSLAMEVNKMIIPSLAMEVNKMIIPSLAMEVNKMIIPSLAMEVGAVTHVVQWLASQHGKSSVLLTHQMNMNNTIKYFPSYLAARKTRAMKTSLPFLKVSFTFSYLVTVLRWYPQPQWAEQYLVPCH